ncbi:MAG TPA: hypothetical protein VLT83_07685, partial [Opitutaceae bacterium]|nr:hypothetical protein [Opitutaceae bacterium]
MSAAPWLFAFAALPALQGVEAQQSSAPSWKFLQVDGYSVGFLKGCEGGVITAQVVTEPPGTSAFAKKHIEQPQYEPVTLKFDFSMSTRLYDRITAAWQGGAAGKTYVITYLDSKLQPTG